MKKQKFYTSPSIKVMRMAMKKGVMIDTFSGGDPESGLIIDKDPDQGQINRSNRSVWDDQL